MKRLTFFVLVVLGIVAGLWLGLWFVVSRYSKSKYDVLLQQDHAVSFAVTPIDQQSKALISEVQSNWSHRDDRTNSQISGVLTLAGLAPSVRNVIHVLQTPMPEFYWWSAFAESTGGHVWRNEARVLRLWHASDVPCV